MVEKRLQHYLRVAGCTTLLEAAGYPFDPTLLIYGDSSAQSGERAAHALLTRSDPPSAIFATNDLMAIGALSAAWKLGLAVPRDLSVVGFDDIALSAYTTPPLTTVLIDRVLLMEKALEAILALIEQKDFPPLMVLKPTLTIRESASEYVEGRS